MIHRIQEGGGRFALPVLAFAAAALLTTVVGHARAGASTHPGRSAAHEDGPEGRAVAAGDFDAVWAPRAATTLEPAQSSASEDKDEAFEKVDPYTKGDAAAMEKAGYQSFGPFLFAECIKTQDIEAALGNVQLLWVETEHFKRCSTLRTYK